MAVTALAWSPDSMRLASREDDGTLHVWNTATGRQILRHHRDPYRAHALLPVSIVAWSPDGRYLASAVRAAGYPIHVWDVTTGQQVYRHFEGLSLVYALAWSHEGRKLLLAGQEGIVVPAPEGAPEWDLLMFHRLESVAREIWSPDCQYLALGATDGRICLWESSTGTCLLRYQGHTDHVSALAWSPNGQHIVSAGRERTVQVWDTTTGTHLFSYQGHAQVVTALAWSPDGARIASCAGHSVHIWEPERSSRDTLARGLQLEGSDHVSICSLRNARLKPEGRRKAVSREVGDEGSQCHLVQETLSAASVGHQERTLHSRKKHIDGSP